jgi:hypothetical protein
MLDALPSISGDRHSVSMFTESALKQTSDLPIIFDD